MPAGFKSVNVTPDAADDLRTFAAHASGLVGRRVPLSIAMRLACRLAGRHVSARDALVKEQYEALIADEA